MSRVRPASAAIAFVAIATGCDPLSPQAFFAASWNDEDACLEKNAAVDVYDDEETPACTSSATCVTGPEKDGQLYVTTCPIPVGWSTVDEAQDARCQAAIDAYRAGDEGRCP
jgi:hypothetical protein